MRPAHALWPLLLLAACATGDDFDPSHPGADSLDADTIEALRAIGYFGN